MLNLKSTLRVLLVLLHDYPEFLCDYHFSFCDVIPPSCIQMGNIILSARSMRLPDPSTPNLTIDLVAESSQPPRILSEVDAALKAKLIKGDLDKYMKMRQLGSLFLTELKQTLLLPPGDAARAGTRYNVPLINSLVLYVGMQRFLIDLFQFLEPFLRNAELEEPVHFLYKGTLRVLLVLLHDYSKFLCDYHFSFCAVIPPSCIQMRNVILSAFPRHMRLPDSSTPNLKIDQLAEISQPPPILSEVDAALKAKLIG